MTTSCIRILFILVFILSAESVSSQESFLSYLQPQLALNYNVTTSYSQNFTLSSRNFIYREDKFRLEGRNFDISHFSNFKTGVNTSFGAGLMYRFRKLFDNTRTNELRLTQQLNTTTRPMVVRYGHRWRTEQRFFPDVTVHRFRYRFTLDFPLEGEKVDINEAYLILNTEALLSVASGRGAQYDQRFTAALGWLLEDTVQLQAGLEYRLENYTRNTQPVLFLNSSLIFSL
ncbi:DUF2490 domain-containing protein [Muriicola sp. E247]|uniref:DUF2490 domain-containing protein n=1 Tax=Muriicola sp. E247 TaxID=3242730 RepID=UPI003524914F